MNILQTIKSEIGIKELEKFLAWCTTSFMAFDTFKNCTSSVLVAGLLDYIEITYDIWLSYSHKQYFWYYRTNTKTVPAIDYVEESGHNLIYTSKVNPLLNSTDIKEEALLYIFQQLEHYTK